MAGSLKLVKQILFWLVLALACVRSASAIWTSKYCPNDRSLSYFGDGERLPEIYDTLIACGNIDSLSVRMVQIGCTIRGIPWAFPFRANHRFPNIKNLTVEGYRFWDTTPPYVRSHLEPSLLWELEKMFADKLPSLRREPSLERWRRAMNFSQLEHLTMEEDAYFWQRMQHDLPNLRSFAADVAGLSDPLVAFLNAVPPLESLAVRNYRPLLGSNATLDCSPSP